VGLNTRLAGIAPWTALIAAGAAWALHQQVVAQALHFDCQASAGYVGIAWGVFALAIVCGGTVVSWRTRPAATDASALAAVRRFAVDLGIMAAMLATLGIAFQILAGVLLPGCPP
jgi:hypothetical protein